jgi:hypothetical protein
VARDLATLLAMMLTSAMDGEVLAARRQLQKVLKAAGLSGNDIAQAVEQRGKLLAAAKELKAERDQALGEVERLKRLQQANGADSSFAQQLWQPAGMPATVDNRHAQWLLDLDAQGRIYLSQKENDFVTSCVTRRRLTEPMRESLQDLVRKAIARTGEAPPP